MGRARATKLKKPIKLVEGHRNEYTASRTRSSKNAAEVRETMRCSSGLTTIRNEGVVENCHYANGECSVQGGLFRVTVQGPKGDIVILAFEAALERIGFKRDNCEN